MGAFDWILPSQMPQPLGLGPMATLAPIQKAANNVTAGNPQGPKVPWVDPASVTNALTNISTAKSENQLRQQQATLTGMQATQAGWQLKMLQQMYNSPTIRQAFGLDTGDGAGTGGATMPSGAPTDTGTPGNPSGGMPPSSDNSAQSGAPLGPQLGGSAPGPGSKSDPRGMIPVITAAAQKYGVDPAVALKVAQSEGLGEFLGDGGQSGGAFQLYTGGGLGNQFQKDTGLNPLDPKNEPATIDYAMKYASQNGWGPWHGAAQIGLGTWDGIGTPPPAGAQPPGAAPGAHPPATPFGMAIGDSIAHGVQDAAGVGGDTKDGRSTAAVLQAINSADPATLKGQRVFLSSGASNSPDQLAPVMQQIALLQQRGAQPVLAGVGPGVANADQVNQALAKIAAFYKIPFTGALTNTGADGVHPRDYNGLISQVAGLGGPPAAPPVQVAQNGPMQPGSLAPPVQPGQAQPAPAPATPSPAGVTAQNPKLAAFASQIRAAAGLPQQQPAPGQVLAAAAVPPGIGARMAETGKSMTNTPALAAFANQIRARAGLPTQPAAQAAQPQPGAPYGNPAQTPVPVTGAPGMASAPPLAVGGMTQKQMLALGLMGQMSGMPNLAAPFEQAFYNSPEYKAAVKKAETLATMPITIGSRRPGNTDTVPILDAQGNVTGERPIFTAPSFQPNAGGYNMGPGQPFVPTPGYPEGVGAVRSAQDWAGVGPKITIEQNTPKILSPTDTLAIPGQMQPTGAGPQPSSAPPGQPAGQPGAPAPSPAVGNGGNAPGVLRPGISPLYQGAVQTAVNADQERLSKTLQPMADKANDTMATAQLIHDTLPNVSAGWTADTKADAARVMAALGVSDANIKFFTSTNAASADVLTKMFLNQTAGAVRVMGAREPGSVIQMFSKAYPSLETQPGAIRMIENVLTMQAQRAQDEFALAQQYQTQSLNGLRTGQPYQPLSQFEASFNSGAHSSVSYLKAAQALSGDKAAWAGMKPDNFDAIWSLIPSGRPFLAPDGKWRTKP